MFSKVLIVLAVEWIPQKLPKRTRFIGLLRFHPDRTAKCEQRAGGADRSPGHDQVEHVEGFLHQLLRYLPSWKLQVGVGLDCAGIINIHSHGYVVGQIAHRLNRERNKKLENSLDILERLIQRYYLVTELGVPFETGLLDITGLNQTFWFARTPTTI